jgi:hypothetical protein
MTVMKATFVMPSPPPAGDDGPQQNSRGLTWEPMISTGMRGKDGDDADSDADSEEEASQVDDGSIQNVED